MSNSNVTNKVKADCFSVWFYDRKTVNIVPRFSNKQKSFVFEFCNSIIKIALISECLVFNLSIEI